MTISTSAPRRLASLDVLRGLTLIGMICANYSDDLKEAGFHVFPLLLHAHWEGFHIADSLFPGFLLMSGVSIPLAGKSDGLTAGAFRTLLFRSLRLILIGVLVSNSGWIMSPFTETFRPEGVLQRIGVAYFFAGLLYYTTGPRQRLSIAAALLLGYWLLASLPFPDGTTNFLVRGANFSSWIDRAVFGSHVYVTQPLAFDPEGLLGDLPAIAQALIGVAVGQWVLARKDAGRLALAGIAMIVVGLAWSLFFPIVKALWSSSFVLLSSGVATLALSGLYAVMDRRGLSLGWTAFLTAFGINSIFAYVLHQIFEPLLQAPILKTLYLAASPYCGDEVAALLPIAVLCALMSAVLLYMRKRAWIVKV